MNPSSDPVVPKLRIVLALLASLAMLAAACVSLTASAGASTGGVSASGGTSGSGGGKYQRLWENTSHRDKRWARHTAECESGKDPNAIGGGGAYRGAFMFLRSSWHHAPKTPGGDPIDYSYRTQAVVAVALKHDMGTKPWPVCG
jgi:soluble lytic murein transglycosylase-like protein